MGSAAAHSGRVTRRDGLPCDRGLVSTAFRSTEILLAWVIRFIPFAVFGVVAKTIGEQGFAPLRGLAVWWRYCWMGQDP